MAERNLHEDESFQSQFLEQFREWIEKEPRIKKCCTDSKFLLKFLRKKKFSIPDAFQLFVNYYTARKIFPHLYENLDINDPDIDYLITTGHITILPDSQGCPVLLRQYDNFDPKRSSMNHIARVMNLVGEILICDPKAQINGIIDIIDYSAMTSEIFEIFKSIHIKEFAYFLKNESFPIRHRVFYLINMPTFVARFFNFFKFSISEKIRNRVKMVNGWDVVRQEVGASVLPKELGGKIPKAELIRALKVKALEHREEILALNDFEIELKGNEVNFANPHDSELDTGIMGSFRKLEVD